MDAIDQDVKMDQNADQNTPDASVNASADHNSTKNDTIPYHRFKEINDQYKDLKDKLLKIDQEKEAMRQKKLEEDGKLKELLSEKDNMIKDLKVKAESWDKYKADRRDVLLSKLPESDREDFADLKLSQLEKVISKLSGSNSGSTATASDSPKRGRTDLKMKDMTRDQVRDNWEDILNKHS